MKRIFFIMTIMIIAVFTLSACGNETSSTTLKTESISTEDEVITEEDGEVAFTVQERGLRFAIPQEYIDRGVVLEEPNSNMNGYRTIQLYYYSPTSLLFLDEIVNMDNDLRTPEVAQEYTEHIWNTSRCLLEITLIETGEYERLIASGGHDEDITYYSPARFFGENEGYTYILSIPELDDGMLTEEEAQEYHACKEYIPTLVEKISFVHLQLESDETVLGAYMPAFTTKDLNGNTVTGEIFRNNTLTVVNMWGTFCMPCIEEMPMLAEWAQSMDERVQLIGIVGDVDGSQDVEHYNLAKTIIEKAGVKYINLIPNEDFSDLLSGLIGYPTTFFVDSTGAIVGEPIVGANVDACKTFVEEYLHQIQ